MTFLDSDDLLMGDSLIDRLIDRLETIAGCGPDAAGTFCGVRISPEDVTLDSLHQREEWRHRRFIDFVSAAAECPFNAHAPLLRTDIARLVGGFDESMLRGAEDWDFWLRVIRRGFSFVPSKWQTAIYRQKFHSMAKDGVQQHVREAQRLIALSYESDPSVNGPRSAHHPFPLPLPVYQQKLVVARRTLQYAATSTIRGDSTTASSILSGNGFGVEPWMDRHIDFENVINAGFRRALGLTPKDISELADTLDPLRLHVKSLIPSTGPSSRGREPSSRTHYDTLFAPQNAVQAKEMLLAADNLPDSHGIAFGLPP